MYVSWKFFLRVINEMVGKSFCKYDDAFKD